MNAANVKRLFVAIALLVGILVTTGCANSQFLGVRVPAYCDRDPISCRLWAQQQVRDQSTLRIVALPKLQRYLQSIVDRLVAANGLAQHPTIRLGYDEPTGVHGNVIDFEITRLADLSSEADVAGVIAHELVHVVSEHWAVAKAEQSRSGLSSAQRLDQRRNLEQVADERATQLLVKAGYQPAGLLSALRIMLLHCAPAWVNGGDTQRCDDEHPPYFARLASVALAQSQAGFGGGFEGRDAFLAAIDGLSLLSPNQPVKVFAANATHHGESVDWIHHATRLAFRRDWALVTAEAYSRAYGELIAASLGARVTSSTNGRTVISGYWPAPRERSYLNGASENRDSDGSSVIRKAAVDSFDADPDAYVAVIFAQGHALVLWSANADANAVEQSVASVRAATPTELAVHQPTLRIRRATTAGRWHDVGAATCGDGVDLEPADRVVAVGDQVKCKVW